jgi:hypothetical protein
MPSKYFYAHVAEFRPTYLTTELITNISRGDTKYFDGLIWLPKEAESPECAMVMNCV